MYIEIKYNNKKMQIDGRSKVYNFLV